MLESYFLFRVKFFKNYVTFGIGKSEIRSVVSDSLWSRVRVYTDHWILQARILQWVAYPFSRGSSRPRNRTRVSCFAGGFFTNWAIRGAVTFTEGVTKAKSSLRKLCWGVLVLTPRLSCLWVCLLVARWALWLHFCGTIHPTVFWSAFTILSPREKPSPLWTVDIQY